MDIFIKNMVCRHCVDAVKSALAAAGIEGGHVAIGRVSLPEVPSARQLAELDKALAVGGFERITNPDEAVVAKAKAAVLHHVRSEEDCRLKLSACIEEHLGMNYDAVSRIFSRYENRTLEQFYILHKVERVKELLAYKELTLAEIADMTGYSSAAHLSRQFKAVEGITPTEYQRTLPPRKSLEEI